MDKEQLSAIKTETNKRFLVFPRVIRLLPHRRPAGDPPPTEGDLDWLSLQPGRRVRLFLFHRHGGYRAQQSQVPPGAVDLAAKRGFHFPGRRSVLPDEPAIKRRSAVSLLEHELEPLDSPFPESSCSSSSMNLRSCLLLPLLGRRPLGRAQDEPSPPARPGRAAGLRAQAHARRPPCRHRRHLPNASREISPPIQAALLESSARRRCLSNSTRQHPGKSRNRGRFLPSSRRARNSPMRARRCRPADAVKRSFDAHESSQSISMRDRRPENRTQADADPIPPSGTKPKLNARRSIWNASAALTPEGVGSATRTPNGRRPRGPPNRHW